MKFKKMVMGAVAVSAFASLTGCSGAADQAILEQELKNQQALDSMARDRECLEALMLREEQDRVRQEYYDALFAQLEPNMRLR